MTRPAASVLAGTGTLPRGGGRLGASGWMITACGVWLVGLGLYFMLLRPPLLPEDLRFLGASLAQVRATVPALERWLRHVFTVLGGFMTGGGVLTVFIAARVMPSRPKGTAGALALGGASTAALMSATNFALDSDFKWLLLAPALLWLAGLSFYCAGR